MAVVPVGTRLAKLEAIGERFAGLNPRKGDARHAILVIGNQQPVPVNAGHLAELIRHPNEDLVAFPESQHRPRHGAVDGDAHGGLAGDVERRFSHRQVVGAVDRNGADLYGSELGPRGRKGTKGTQAKQRLERFAFKLIHGDLIFLVKR
ncbi:hypothetical protein D9M73_136630 [compost metagenome]